MKKIIVASLGLALCLSSAQAVFADTEDSATAHVTCTVNPNVSVGDAPESRDNLNVQTGSVSGNFIFRVDANTQYLNLMVGASHLYKADDPTNRDVEPILVDERAGVLVDPVFGIGRTIYYITPTEIDGFPGMQTNPEQFESSQNGHFSQDVNVRVTWYQPDPEKPQGEYSGWVSFAAMMLPD